MTSQSRERYPDHLPIHFRWPIQTIISRGPLTLSFAHCYLNLMEHYYHRGPRWLCLSTIRTPSQAPRHLEPSSCTSNLSSGGLTTGQRCRASGYYCSSDLLPWEGLAELTVTCPDPSRAHSPTARSPTLQRQLGGIYK